MRIALQLQFALDENCSGVTSLLRLQYELNLDENFIMLLSLCAGEHENDTNISHASPHQ